MPMPGKEKAERERGKRREEKKLTCGPHYHVSSTSAKPLFKTARWPNINGFDSSIVKNTRF